MTREKFPEKIPFRLTRMLTNAMEVSGVGWQAALVGQPSHHPLQEQTCSLQLIGPLNARPLSVVFSGIFLFQSLKVSLFFTSYEFHFTWITKLTPCSEDFPAWYTSNGLDLPPHWGWQTLSTVWLVVLRPTGASASDFCGKWLWPFYRLLAWMATIESHATRWWKSFASTRIASWPCWKPSSTTPCWTGGWWTVSISKCSELESARSEIRTVWYYIWLTNGPSSPEPEMYHWATALRFHKALVAGNEFQVFLLTRTENSNHQFRY